MPRGSFLLFALVVLNSMSFAQSTPIDFPNPTINKTVPAQVDLRRWAYPVKDQLRRGSCAVFASIGAMEMMGGVPQLSEAYAYSMLKADDLTTEGTNLYQMKAFLDSMPMIESKYMLYNNIVGTQSFGQNATEQQVAKMFNKERGQEARLLAPRAMYQARGVRVYTPAQVNWDWIKRTLANNQPIVLGFSMNGDHWTLAGQRPGALIEKTITVPGPNGVGTRRVEPANNGGHAVLAVGYTQDGKLLFRNSWGFSWGEQGYGYMTQDYLFSHLTSAMTIDYVEPATVVMNRPYHEKFDVRVHGWQDGGSLSPFKSYTVTMSLLRLEPYVTNAPITAVTYTIYDLNTGTQIGQPVTSTAWAYGYYAEFNLVPAKSVRVCVSMRHGYANAPYMGETTGCRDFANVVTFSKAPLF